MDVINVIVFNQMGIIVIVIDQMGILWTRRWTLLLWLLCRLQVENLYQRSNPKLIITIIIVLMLIKLRSSQAWCQSNQIESQAWVVLLTQIYQDWRSEAGGLGWRKMEDWSEVWSFFSWWTIDHRHDIVDVDDHIFPDDDIIFCQYFHGDAILIAGLVNI